MDNYNVKNVSVEVDHQKSVDRVVEVVNKIVSRSTVLMPSAVRVETLTFLTIRCRLQRI